MKTVEIEWSVEDGYANQGRTHSTSVPVSEIKECNSAYAVEQLVERYVMESFDDLVNPGWNPSKAKEVWKQILDEEGDG